MSIISKKKMNEFLSLSNDPKIELIEDSKKSYKIMIIGDKNKVKKSSFEETVLEFIKEQRQFNKKIDQRLDILEKDVNVLKSFHKDDIKKLKSQKEK